jgi:hypothetical protein
MVNDYIEVKDAKIINLAFDITVFVNDISNIQISSNIISKVSNFFNIFNNEINQDVYIGALEREILDVVGVLNVLDVKVYNKIGESYSVNLISQEILDEGTNEIRLINNTLYSTEDSMFEIKYPSKDIRVFLKRKA